jgi:hypothetical protein
MTIIRDSFTFLSKESITKLYRLNIRKIEMVIIYYICI